MAIENFVGKGIVFPIELDSTGTPVNKTGIELINSSIKLILGWDNDRIFLSQFRNRLNDLIEEPNDEVLSSLVRFFIFDSLRIWEKRIEVLDITISIPDPSRLDASIYYRITNTNLEAIFTFPFYREIVF